MLWVLAGVSGWIALLILKEERRLWKSFLGGLIAVVFQIFFDVNAVKLNLYQFHNSIFSLYDSIDIFYTFGLVFSMGTTFTYHLPNGRWLKIIHIMVFAILFVLLEGVLTQANYFTPVNWNFVQSFFVNAFSFMSLAFLVEEFNLRGRIPRW
jgi:hypothetical protein